MDPELHLTDPHLNLSKTEICLVFPEESSHENQEEPSATLPFESSCTLGKTHELKAKRGSLDSQRILITDDHCIANDNDTQKEIDFYFRGSSKCSRQTLTNKDTSRNNSLVALKDDIAQSQLSTQGGTTLVPSENTELHDNMEDENKPHNDSEVSQRRETGRKSRNSHFRGSSKYSR